jgi:hypothetical protein
MRSSKPIRHAVQPNPSTNHIGLCWAAEPLFLQPSPREKVCNQNNDGAAEHNNYDQHFDTILRQESCTTLTDPKPPTRRTRAGVQS